MSAIAELMMITGAAETVELNKLRIWNSLSANLEKNVPNTYRYKFS